MNMNDVLGSILPKKTRMRTVTVAEARRILESEEEQRTDRRRVAAQMV